MADRKSFLLRVDRDTLEGVQRWANDDLRSLNGQIEFLLRRALQQSGRATKQAASFDDVDTEVSTDAGADVDADVE